MPTLFISAGEASGEHYGALLAASLRQRFTPEQQGAALELMGMGGDRMAAAGVECIVRSEDVSVMGLTEVLGHLPRIYREFRKLKKAIRTRRPDAAILIDFPDFHFRLAREFHRLGIPVLYFVSPQLWAWKKHRIHFVRKYIGEMLVIFPFEEPFYREHGIRAEFVGHPLAELPPPTVARERFALENSLDPTKAWIALLPGSRPREIADLLPEILAAARLLSRQHGGELEFPLPLAPTLSTAQRAQVHALVQAHGADLPIRLVDDARAALYHARASVVASGTATVEAALIGNPFVVVYRVSPVTFAVAKRVVKVPHVAMANLIAGKRVVSELIQNDFTAQNIVKEIEPLLSDGAPRQSMMHELAMIHDSLRPRAGAPGAIDRVAAIVLERMAASLPGGVQLPGRP